MHLAVMIASCVHKGLFQTKQVGDPNNYIQSFEEQIYGYSL